MHEHEWSIPGKTQRARKSYGAERLECEIMDVPHARESVELCGFESFRLRYRETRADDVAIRRQTTRTNIIAPEFQFDC